MKMKEYGSENHPTILLLCKKEPKMKDGIL